MNSEYLNVISLIERLHRQFLELVKLELDAMGVRDGAVRGVVGIQGGVVSGC